MDGDPDPANLAVQLLLLFVLILLNAFFALSEIAIVSLNDNKVKKMAEGGHKKAQRILKLTDSSSSFLSTIQIGVTLAGFLASASASQAFVDRFGGFLRGLLGRFGEQNPALVETVSVVVITLIISYFSLVFGELVPKRLALQNPERVSFGVVGVLLFVRACMRPFVAVLSFSTNLVLRLLRIDPNAEPDNVTEEEIRMMVDVGEENGVIEESQKEMINNIFEFDDKTAEDIMTHRTDMLAAEVTDPLEAVAKMALAEGVSRIPVYEDDLDNIVGLIHVKDLLPFLGRNFPADMTARDKMRSVFCVPESKKCGDLFQEMTARHLQMAIVVDEYGGTAGLVTMEDLLESIVGNIQDEYDQEDEEFEQLSDTIFTVDGTTDIEEVAEKLGRSLPEGDYDTVGGMILARLGYIPTGEDHPTVEVNHTLFTVLSVEERRIEKVRVEILPLPAESESKKEAKEAKEKEKDKDKEKELTGEEAG